MTDSLNDSLLLTKLNRPRLPNDQLQRSRLLEWLNHNIDRQLILVSAPAGFGKSAPIGTWLDGRAGDQGEKAIRLPSAWLSLDENDSDHNLFLRYFIAALHTIYKRSL